MVRLVRERVPDLDISVSVTTRAPRPEEREGVHYRFLSEEAFERMVERGELLEWAEIFGHRSGTPAEPVEVANYFIWRQRDADTSLVEETNARLAARYDIPGFYPWRTRTSALRLPTACGHVFVQL